MRPITFRVPDEIYKKLEGIEDKSAYLRKVLADHFGVETVLPDQKAEIERIVNRKVKEILAWHRLK